MSIKSKNIEQLNPNSLKDVRSGVGFFNSVEFCLALFCMNNPNIAEFLSFSFPLTLTLEVILLKEKGIQRKEDIQEIKELYNQFITNYNKLNRMLNLEDPIEIYTMFSYLVWNGYLSSGRKFNFANYDINDLRGLGGVDVLVGRGVCRNISRLLSDILNNYGITSHVLHVVADTSSDKPEDLDNDIADFIKQFVTDEEQRQKYIDKYTTRVDGKLTNSSFHRVYSFLYNILAPLAGNHDITGAYKDGYIYYLDPTNCDILKMSEEKKRVLYYKDIEYKLTNFSGIKTLKRAVVKTSGTFDMYNTLSDEEQQQKVKATRKICEKNEDLFNKFYNNNKEIYDEIYTKARILKSR